MHNRGGAEEDDAMTGKTAQEGLEGERDESKGGAPLRRLWWTTDGERGAPTSRRPRARVRPRAVAPGSPPARGRDAPLRVLARRRRRCVGRGRRRRAGALVRRRQYRSRVRIPPAGRRSRGGLRGDRRAFLRRGRLSPLDACVDALCAAEAAAASAGWAPAPPATGPLEAAARARDRGIEGAIRAEVLADARRVFLDASDAELYATFRAGGESEAIEANRWQSPMSWDPSKEDDALFSNPSTERDDSSSPGNTGNTTETAPALAASTVSTVARRLADVAVGALESAVGAASTELDASAKRGTPPNRAALVRALARARGAADAADAFRVLAPAARARARTERRRSRTLRPFVYSHHLSERRDGEQLWGELGPESVADAGRTRRACSVTTRGTSRRVGSRRRTRRGTRSSAARRAARRARNHRKRNRRNQVDRPRFL